VNHAHGEPDPAELRQRYGGPRLTSADLWPDPIEQFRVWLADAVAAPGLPEPNAMVLATATPEGRPSARTVLLKGYGAYGFRFFTNHTSRKARELTANPVATLLFPWHPLGRQVIVEGSVERVPAHDSAEYFHSRPYGSQIGAWASERQSAVLGSRSELDRRFAELTARWPEGTEVPAPEFWGGYQVVPTSLEFWQGQPDRLHDRFRYRRTDQSDERAAAGGGGWIIERLSP
jgi:pyridoxamine 5'-phosphate oxidase